MSESKQIIRLTILIVILMVLIGFLFGISIRKSATIHEGIPWVTTIDQEPTKSVPTCLYWKMENPELCRVKQFYVDGRTCVVWVWSNDTSMACWPMVADSAEAQSKDP